MQLLRAPGRDRGPARCSTAHDLFDARGRRAARGAARRSRSSSRTRSRRSNPRMRVFDILEEGPAGAAARDGRAGAPRRASRRWSSRSACGATRCERYPARVLRRPAAAHRDRARAGGAAAADRLRRADLGARRVGAGADPQPAARSCSASSACRYLFITHNIGVVEYLADDVAVMQRGPHRGEGADERGARAPAVTRTRARCWPPCRASCWVERRPGRGRGCPKMVDQRAL